MGYEDEELYDAALPITPGASELRAVLDSLEDELTCGMCAGIFIEVSNL